jgi:hypothetical protein
MLWRCCYEGSMQQTTRGNEFELVWPWVFQKSAIKVAGAQYCWYGRFQRPSPHLLRMPTIYRYNWQIQANT